MIKNKIDAPFSEVVVPYFKTHSNDEYLEIYCGANSCLYAEWDAISKGVKPSLCLPHLHDFKSYWWPVEDLTIVLNWSYKDTDLQIEFANYLTNVCRAYQVFTLVSGDILKFQHERRLAA